MAKDKSCKGNLSFSVVRANDLKPVSDKKTKSSAIACTLSRATQPTPRITSLSANVPPDSGPSYITILFLPNITSCP